MNGLGIFLLSIWPENFNFNWNVLSYKKVSKFPQCLWNYICLLTFTKNSLSLSPLSLFSFSSLSPFSSLLLSMSYLPNETRELERALSYILPYYFIPQHPTLEVDSRDDHVNHQKKAKGQKQALSCPWHRQSVYPQGQYSLQKYNCSRIKSKWSKSPSFL